MTILAISIASIASLFMILCSIAFLRAKDVYTMSHVVIIANCYIIPLILLSITLSRFSYDSFIKISALIILNIVIANLLTYVIVRRAMSNRITPDAVKKKS